MAIECECQYREAARGYIDEGDIWDKNKTECCMKRQGLDVRRSECVA